MYYYKVTRGYLELSYLNKEAFAKVTGIKTDTNPTFPDMPHKKAAIDLAAGLVHTCYVAWMANKGKTEDTALKNAEAALNTILNENADYVDMMSGGDKTKIESSGYVATKEKSFAPKAKINVEPGSVKGSILLEFMKEDNEKAVIWMEFPGKTPPETFDRYGFCKATLKNSVEKPGYVSGEWLTIIGAAILSNSDDELIWSEPFKVLVP